MDQKPLEAILSKSLLEASPQRQQLLMKIIPYDMVVQYIPGATSVVAGCLLRAPITSDRIQLPILQVYEITNALKCTADCLQQLHEKMIHSLFSNIPFRQAGHKNFNKCHLKYKHTGHSGMSSLLRMGLFSKIPELSYPHQKEMIS